MMEKNIYSFSLIELDSGQYSIVESEKFESLQDLLITQTILRKKLTLISDTIDETISESYLKNDEKKTN